MKIFFAAVVAISIFGAGANAHSFNVTLIVPLGDQAAAMQAFLLASGERDGHAEEESDGHLGGLDVYVSVVENDGDFASLANQVMTTAPDIVVTLGALAQNGDFSERFSDPGLWLLPLHAVLPKAEQAFLQSGPVPFADRFLEQSGSPADKTAMLTYVAARLIDLAVRPQDGVGDLTAMQLAIQGY